jgi:non-ribosomal peptide synthase protein (TIGR01720 family)
VGLSPEETEALLREAPQAYHTQINDLLLAGLLLAFQEWSGQSALLVDLEGHGREGLFEGVDLSRTVGWFTSLFPVWLELGEGAGVGEALKGVKEQLRQVPERGIAYGLLRYLSGDERLVEQLQGLARAEVSFNYLGQFGAGTEAGAGQEVSEARGHERSPKGQRAYLIEIDGLVSSGRLELSFSYGSKLHRRETVERLAQSYLEALRSLIAHCRSPEAGGYTPSDFADVSLSQDQLDSILSELGFTEDRSDELEAD